MFHQRFMKIRIVIVDTGCAQIWVFLSVLSVSTAHGILYIIMLCAGL